MEVIGCLVELLQFLTEEKIFSGKLENVCFVSCLAASGRYL